MSVNLTPAAQADIQDIKRYIGRENPAAASRVIATILTSCDRLAFLPRRGRMGRAPGTRELTVLSIYVVVYRITANGLEILRVWHGAQSRN